MAIVKDEASMGIWYSLGFNVGNNAGKALFLRGKFRINLTKTK